MTFLQDNIYIYKKNVISFKTLRSSCMYPIYVHKTKQLVVEGVSWIVPFKCTPIYGIGQGKDYVGH